MKKAILLFVFLLSMAGLVGCIQSDDPELIAIQSQYDAYRMSEFSDYQQFADYMNTFSLETAHAAVYAEVQYRFFNLPGTTPIQIEQAVGFIVNEDDGYYQVLTESRIFNQSGAQSIVVHDIFDKEHRAMMIYNDEATGLALISFVKSDDLGVVDLAENIPLNQEPIVVLSYLNGIRNQVTLGYFMHEEISYNISINQAVEEGLYGGGVFDVNHRLVGMISSVNDKSLIMYEDIALFLDKV